MPELCKKELCTGCTACAAACPQRCIQMERDQEGFLRPFVNEDSCIACGMCSRACPILQERAAGATSLAYAALNHDEEIRRSSSSGGVFTLLCRWVLERDGTVFGASYDEDFTVRHYWVEEEEELHKLRSAKYAQSDLGDTFRDVKKLLEQGQWVLFSGTPCQVGGLVSYLGVKHERLLLVDLICHGVPSPGVWERYVECRAEKDGAGSRPTFVNLRSKETGWPGYSIRFDFANGATYSRPNNEDTFLRCFVGDLCLRPSCYQCRFKGENRPGDITLGDYWGVWSQLPECHDGNGTSLVLVNTEQGRMLWDEVMPAVQCRAVDMIRALEDNPLALRSAICPDKRAEFMSRYRKEDFDALVDTLRPIPKAPPPPSLMRRLIRKLKG